jgi:hypothetical protein
VTRNKRPNRLTIEKFASDSLDVRELRRRRILGDEWVKIGPSLRWLRIACMRVARYRIIIQLWKQATPQNIPVSWTKCHLGGLRPWMHCPYCEKRVAKLYRGLGGYFCRACIGNPIYASQSKSAQGRRHFHACKLRLHLNGEASLTAPFPERPRGMHRRTYERLRQEGLKLEAGLSRRVKSRFPDYPNLVAYSQRLPIDLGD